MTEQIEQKRPRNYQVEVVNQIEKIREREWLKVNTIKEIKYGNSHYPIFSILSSPRNEKTPNVFLSAGVHGVEPGGVYALLNFFEKEAEAYKHRVNFFAIPCVDPSGFEDDTRKTRGGININTDFLNLSPAPETFAVKEFLERANASYIFAIDMHEDRSDQPAYGFDISQNPKGFYFYESSVDECSKMGPKIMNMLEKNGVLICKDKTIYGEKSENGVIWRKWHGINCSEEEDTLEDHIQRYTQNSFTLETPTAWTLEQRIDTHVKTLRYALDCFLSG